MNSKVPGSVFTMSFGHKNGNNLEIALDLKFSRTPSSSLSYNQAAL